ncbi:mRpL1 [Trypoxylus dichotomus]
MTEGLAPHPGGRRGPLGRSLRTAGGPFEPKGGPCRELTLGKTKRRNHSSLNYAARRGTREKRKKQKVKVEEEKVGFVPHNQRDDTKVLAARVSRKVDDSWKRLPIDDVYAYKYYQWRVYEFIEAVECHQQTHHPEMYNQPNAPLHLIVELDMAGEKKNKFLDNFSSIAAVPHKFEHGEERSIVAFTKDPETFDGIRQAGAQLVGGPDLVKQFQSGNLSVHDFQFILAHPNILPELVVLRGLMKKKFPNIKSGTLEVNLAEAVDKFKTGIQYTAIKDEFEKDFGSIEVILGRLNMDPKHLEANFDAVINSILSFKPKRQGTFIRRCILMSPPSREKFKIDHNKCLKKTEATSKKADVITEEQELQSQTLNM